MQGRFGRPMQFDHRRILATGMGRMRGKLKYRPIVFELMDTNFTLLDLQRTVEAISGIRLHKQNFRRLVENGGLVERTGKRTSKAGGRPAEQFRFRREVLRERPTPGVRVPMLRTARPSSSKQPAGESTRCALSQSPKLPEKQDATLSHHAVRMLPCVQPSLFGALRMV